jgi:hypothetical protein
MYHQLQDLVMYHPQADLQITNHQSVALECYQLDQ